MRLTEHIDRVVRRSDAFLRKQEPGHLLINAEIPVGAPPIPSLHEFDLASQLGDWLEATLAEGTGVGRMQWLMKVVAEECQYSPHPSPLP